jgi:N-sulfoglucosamine sulfohydrolase
MSRTRPNIVYIVCHDLGKHLNCYGISEVTSPGLDRLAGEGVMFTNYFCQSPACSPSRGCAMTGQYAHTNGLMGLINSGWAMPPETRTIVDEFNDAGYETVHFGFQHERYAPAENRYQIEGCPFYPWDDRDVRIQEWAEVAVDNAIAYLTNHAGSDQPFYLNIGTLEVHESRWGGTQFLVGSAENRSDVYGVDPRDRVNIPANLPDTPLFRERMARFQGAIRYLDSQVQRLLNAIGRLGYRENTIVVFTTDHGIANERAKGWLYDRGVEIALLMRLPADLGAGALRHAVVDDLIANIDIAPTLLEAAGIPIPSRIQGRSFWPRLIGAPYEPREALVTERNYHGEFDPMRAVRTRRYHYIRNFDADARRAHLPTDLSPAQRAAFRLPQRLWPEHTAPRPTEELYDICADPNEWDNLAENPQFAGVKDELAQHLDRWMIETVDPLTAGPIPDRLNPWSVPYREA